MFGGFGLRRDRTSHDNLNDRDAMDFCRVLYAQEIRRYTFAFAEMKLPGDGG